MRLSVFQALQVASACAGDWQSNVLSKTYACAGQNKNRFQNYWLPDRMVKYEGHYWGETSVD